MFALVLAAAIQVPQSGPALTQVIAARDAALFETFFRQCDPAKMAGFLTPDLEFYHDKNGVVARSAKEFVDMYAK